MMIIVGILRQTGVFEYIAIWAAKRAKGSPFRVMVLLVLITAFASALLDNVTTVLLIAPVTLLVCERLGVSPVPFLIAEVLASNIGGAATLIGDPPNIIIASRSGLTFNDFLVHMTPIAALAIAVLVAMLPLLSRIVRGRSRQSRRCDGAQRARHIEPSVVALLGAGILVLVSRSKPGDFMPSVEWETLLFFAGLFVMIGALVKTGVIGQIAEAAARATGGDPLTATMLILFVSALLSGVVDNIPYTAAMSPIVLQLTQGIADPVQADARPVVVACDWRGLRRKPDCDRRERQRRRPWRDAVRFSHLVLGVHQEGRHRHCGNDPARGALPVAALFRVRWVTP
jgi:Na+/H+ antiporter NhaD/arsenite permease-like protein